MGDFSGKKMLLLGESVGTLDILQYAQEGGAEVYITERDTGKASAAKRLADRVFSVDTADADALVSLVKQEGIDCVYAGISEFNLKQAMKVSQICGLPFYCTLEQWDQLENKALFRELCQRYDVPVPRTFRNIEDVAQSDYPVYVKPVDGTASRGVFCCNDQSELIVCAEQARANSPQGEIIIEERVEGYEFTAHYSITGGVASLSCVDNRLPVAVHEGDVTTIPAGRVYPSLFIDEYIEQVDEAIRGLLESLGLAEGVFFLQAIYDPSEKRFAVFEGGLRSAGECPYRLLERITGVSHMKLLVDALFEEAEAGKEVSAEDPMLHGKVCAVVSLVGRHGIVGEIVGLNEALAIDAVVEHELRYGPGDEIPDTDTLVQLVLRFFLICDSREDLMDVVSQINSTVDVYDRAGESLAIKLEPARVLSYI